MATVSFSAAYLASVKARMTSSYTLESIASDCYALDQVAAGLTVVAADIVETPWLDLQGFNSIGRIVAIKQGLASVGEQLELLGSADGATSLGNLLSAILAINALALNITSAVAMSVVGLPISRYVKVRYTNGITPQTGLKLLLALTRS